MSHDLLSALQDPKTYPHPISAIQRLETHISWVFLTGDYVYKVKKPVDFGFLDYSTLEKRRFYCEEELRLNQSLAPSIYLKVVPITQKDGKYEIDGNGEIVEYAVQMKEFSQENLLDNVLAKGQLTLEIVDDIAKQIAHFHMKSEKAPADSDYGTLEAIQKVAVQNFDQARELLHKYHIANATYLSPLEELEDICSKEFDRVYPLLEARKKQGFIRSCHSDLHLGNIALIDGNAVIFDCVEFNEYFRLLDVMADVAFLLMDFFDREREDLGMRFLNTYMTYTGDYEGLLVLPYYFSYRAMVRAKVQLFNINPEHSEEKREEYFAKFISYVHLTLRYFEDRKPFLLLMHGFSGAGKSTAAIGIADNMQGIAIHSDIERKRICHKSPLEKLEEKAYSPEMTEKTYKQLQYLTEIIVAARYPVIVDATFLKVSQRKPFIDFALQHKLRFAIIHFDIPMDTLERRLHKRATEDKNFSDADVVVVKRQKASYEPLTAEEKKWVVPIHSTRNVLLDVVSEVERTLENPPHK